MQSFILTLLRGLCRICSGIVLLEYGGSAVFPALKLLSHVTQAKEGTNTHRLLQTGFWTLCWEQFGLRKPGAAQFLEAVPNVELFDPQSPLLHLLSVLSCPILTIICIVDIEFIDAMTKWVETKAKSFLILMHWNKQETWNMHLFSYNVNCSKYLFSTAIKNDQNNY